MINPKVAQAVEDAANYINLKSAPSRRAMNVGLVVSNGGEGGRHRLLHDKRHAVICCDNRATHTYAASTVKFCERSSRPLVRVPW
jgi:hypothetical protein